MRVFRLMGLLNVVLCGAVLPEGFHPCVAMCRAGGSPEITEDDRKVVMMLSEAHQQFATRPESGRIRAQTTIPMVSGKELAEIEVWWSGDNYKQQVLSHSVYAGSDEERLRRAERHRRITRISTPKCRIVSWESVDDAALPRIVSRGELPQFDPARGKTIAHVEPQNSWYLSGGIGNSVSVAELLLKLTKTEYPNRVTTATEEGFVELVVHSDRNAGMTARFDVGKEVRVVEIHSWSNEAPTYSRLTRYEWAPNDVVGWRLARLEYGLGSSFDSDDRDREWQVLTVDECEFAIEIPDQVFSCNQIETPIGTIIRDYASGAEAPTEFVVGVEKSQERVPQELLDRLGDILKKDGFGSPNGKQ